jgi:AcrR family transcriptional regulator
MQPMSDRSSYHHGDLRNGLIEAAVRLVEAKGVAGLSLRAVAREAGVSQAAPYHHFRDKEALMAEVCRLGFDRLGERMAEAAERTEGDAMVRLQAVGRAYVAFSREQRAYFLLMWGGHVHDQTCFPELEASARCTFEMLVQLICDGQQAGELRQGNPLELALSAWSAVHGVARLLVDKGLDGGAMADKGVTPELVVEGTLAMISRGLAPA